MNNYYVITQHQCLCIYNTRGNTMQQTHRCFVLFTRMLFYQMHVRHPAIVLLSSEVCPTICLCRRCKHPYTPLRFEIIITPSFIYKHTVHSNNMHQINTFGNTKYHFRHTGTTGFTTFKLGDRQPIIRLPEEQPISLTNLFMGYFHVIMVTVFSVIQKRIMFLFRNNV